MEVVLNVLFQLVTATDYAEKSYGLTWSWSIFAGSSGFSETFSLKWVQIRLFYLNEILNITKEE